MGTPQKILRQHHHPLQEYSALVSLLRACCKTKDLNNGRRAHAGLLKFGLLEINSYAVVSMYAKCGELDKSKELLLGLHVRDVVCWTELMAGYVQRGQGEEALTCFERMQHEGVSPNAVTFSCILKACSSTGAFVLGEQIHEEIARQGLLGNDVVLGNALVDMYAKMGALAKARRVLEELPVRNVFTWTALIAGYAQKSGEEALDCFKQMQAEHISPNVVTFVSMLKACASIGAIEEGEQIHGEISRQGLLGKNCVLGNALVDMYAKCGALEKAQEILKELPAQNVVMWTTLIAGFAQQDQGERALDCLEWMQQKGTTPNAVTYASALKACGIIGAIEKGEEIHNNIKRQGLLGKDVVLCNALVDMYAKCGVLSKARHVMEELHTHNVVAWSSLIAGYAQQGRGDDALECFEQMQSEGLTPNAVTFASILKACGSIGAADKGVQIHDEIAQQGLLSNNVVLGSALLDMYVKCGAVARAQQVLEELPVQNAVSWTTLVAGYAQQGQIREALNCIKQMQCKGFSPNVVTFSCLLYACSRAGLVDEGQMFYANMCANYGTKANIVHCTCMADLFGRAGHLERAAAVIEQMPASPYSAVWSALLNACQKSGDVPMARWAFEHALQGDKSHAAAYVLMANIYRSADIQENCDAGGGK